MKKNIFGTMDKIVLKLLAPQSLEKVYTTIVEEGKALAGAEFGCLSLRQNKKLVEVFRSSSQLPARPMVEIPLAYKTANLGVLTFYSKKGASLKTEELERLRAYGALVSLILLKSKQYDELAKELAIRDRFIAFASHELRNSLTAINGYIQLLYKIGKDDNTKQSRWIKELYQEGNRFTTLVKDLLDGKKIKNSLI